MDPTGYSRVILTSLALRYARVIEVLSETTGRAIAGVHVVGGGSRNDFLNQATANATRLPVRAGPVEASATGNVIVQAMTDGAFPSLAAARDFVGRSAQVRVFQPRAGGPWDEARQRFRRLEDQGQESPPPSPRDA